MPARSNPLQLVQLEDRTVPTGWLDPTNLTVSFVKDGTTAGAYPSSLLSSFGPGADTTALKREILRGLQSWAAVANVNIGLVRDGGNPFGTAGNIQGDSRFGDIRVGGTPQSANILATTTPFDWTVGTWSGDVLFNTTAHFGINPTNQPGVDDLYTVAVHEAGHALGLGHSTDPLSVMADGYTGAKTGLSASDVAAVQALYGPRVADPYEGATGNETLTTATALTGTNPSVTAELTTTTDVDCYTFVAPANSTKLAVRLRTGGLSLLTAKVTVYDPSGKVVGSDASTDPTRGDMAVRINHVQAGAVYAVKVSANSTDVFGVGRYRLSVGASSDASAGSGNDSQFAGTIANTTDSQLYQFTAPTSATAQVMVIQLSALQKGNSIPTLSVFDASMNPLTYQVIGNDGKTLTAQVPTVTQGAGYFVKVASDGTNATKGNYALTVDFTRAVTDGMTNLQNGTLSSSRAPVAGGTLKLHTTAVFQFVVDTGPTTQSVPAGTTLTLTVIDATGKTVLARAWSAGQSVASYTVYLAAGLYTVQIGLVSTGSGAVVDFWLDGGVYSDPLGTPPPGSGNGPGTTTTTTTDPVTGVVTTTVTTTDPTTGNTTTTVTTTDPTTGVTNTVTTTTTTTSTTDPVTGITTTTTTTTTTDAAAGTTTTTTTTTQTAGTIASGFTYDPWTATATTVAPTTP
jgi:hypothetical protein